MPSLNKSAKPSPALTDSNLELLHKITTRAGACVPTASRPAILSLFAGTDTSAKTAAVAYLAQELNRTVYRIDLAAVVSPRVGETEKNLRLLLDTAATTGAILFFDEADGLFGKRSEVRDSHDRYANIEICYLLERLEQSHSLAIIAANTTNHWPPEALRIFHVTLDFPPA